MEKIATLTEIRSSWTIENVADANDMLDYMAAMMGGSPTGAPIGQLSAADMAILEGQA